MALLFCSPVLYSQERLDLSGGIGIPELLNLNIKYQFKQFQIGIFAGTMPIPKETIYSLGGDLYYHFAGETKYSDLKPWYFKAGLNYLYDENSEMIEKYTYFNFRTGYNMYDSKNLGLDMYIGICYQLSRQKIDKVPPGYWDFNFNFKLLPSIGFAIFYRL